MSKRSFQVQTGRFLGQALDGGGEQKDGRKGQCGMSYST